jgi:hypothetical protein
MPLCKVAVFQIEIHATIFSLNPFHNTARHVVVLSWNVRTRASSPFGVLRFTQCIWNVPCY